MTDKYVYIKLEPRKRKMLEKMLKRNLTDIVKVKEPFAEIIQYHFGEWNEWKDEIPEGPE